MNAMSTAIKHPVVEGDIVLGSPLPWDVYDGRGTLLLRRGFVVESERQLQSLLERGLYVDADAYQQYRMDQGLAAPKPQDASALGLVNAAHAALESVLSDMLRATGIAAAQQRVLQVAQMLDQAIGSNPDLTLACILFNHSAENYATRHSLDAATISMLAAKAMNKSQDEVMTIAAAALTMNVGMLALQEKMQDQAQELSAEEIVQIRHHPQAAHDLLLRAGIADADWLAFVLHHHENIDGSGYPAGKTGADIPGGAKLISLADRYSARISPRNYRKAMLPNDALRSMLVESGKTLDAALTSYFIRELGIYPPGSLVKLQSGEIGVVTRRGKTATTPVVHAAIGPRGAPLPFPHRRETDKERYAIRESVALERTQIPFSMAQLWGKDAQAQEID